MKHKAFFLIILFSYSLSMSTAQPPLIITIHGTTQTITNDQQCLKEQWGNNNDSACECCLLQQYTNASGKKTADEIISICINDKKICSEESITSLKSTKKISQATSNILLEALYHDIVMIPMTFDTSLLQNNGQFSETSLPKFLAQAYQEKKLTHPDFSKEACLKAKNLGTQGGYNTLQLFLVTSTCSSGPASLYIIKEAREGIEEATKLKELEQLTQLKGIIAPNVKSGLPSISLPLAYFAYPDANTVHYIAAMPSAKGKALSDLIIKFRDNQTAQNEELLKRAFTILGKETAHFHQLFSQGHILGNTVVHGDFHVFNIFFDEIAAHCTFIDNETMARSIKNHASPAVDITKLFFMPFSINDAYQQFRDLIKGVDLQKWHDIAVKNFIVGYASAYPKNQEKKVYEELKKIFNEPFSIAWVNFNNTQLQDIRTQYINPIFDELIKQ